MFFECEVFGMDCLVNAEAIEVLEMDDVATSDGTRRERRIVAHTDHFSRVLWSTSYYPDEKQRAVMEAMEKMLDFQRVLSARKV
jgi:hypothetical protein